MKPRHGLSLFLFAAFPLLFFPACSRSSQAQKLPESAAEVSPGRELRPAGPVWPALAVLKTGKYPIWFEYSASGPKKISSPGEAAPADFTPWPLSRFAAGMVISDSNLVMAVNRAGFLVFSPAAEKAAVTVYYAAEPARWDPYTVASVFIHDKKPAVLLYRDSFFGQAAAPKPEPQVEVLAADEPKPKGLSVAALEFLPKEEGWEAASLRLGADGSWYSRFVQTGNPRPQTAYYKTASLYAAGERIDFGEYMASSMPERASAAPPAAASLMEADDFFPGPPGGAVPGFVSPDFQAARFFSASPAARPEESTLLFGYCEGETAFVLNNAGEGTALSAGKIFRFALPPLPRGFVYTHAGLAGDVLVAAWEDQEAYTVGAAGFMALSAEAVGF